ncbi:hypothetical protein ABC304_04875 [Microbacterium sp. 1P10UB]|uniref:hypothetical protein n=1 Tax=unclassified Microbacterium TaxID=2609290 RepID=UPI0039A315D6
MSPLSRRAGAAASVAIAVGVLAGCSASEPQSNGGDGGFTPLPTKSVDASLLPTGAAVEAWALVALPDDKVGGSTEVARGAGEVEPGKDAVIDLTQDEGQWQLTLVCQSADGSAMTMTPAPVETNELQPLRCSTAGDAARGDLGSIAFSGGSGHSLTLSTTVPAVYTYVITPQTANQD